MEQNKTLKEGDKINLIKRRVELFSDENKKVKNYFRKLITF